MGAPHQADHWQTFEKNEKHTCICQSQNVSIVCKKMKVSFLHRNRCTAQLSIVEGQENEVNDQTQKTMFDHISKH